MSDESDQSIPIIADFGYAKQMNEELRCTRLVGTRGFLEPEMLCFEPYCNKVDIWSFGVLLYELVFCDFPIPELCLKLPTAKNEHYIKLVENA